MWSLLHFLFQLEAPAGARRCHESTAAALVLLSLLLAGMMECDVFDWSEEEWCESDESNYYCEENEWEELKSEKKS